MNVKANPHSRLTRGLKTAGKAVLSLLLIAWLASCAGQPTPVPTSAPPTVAPTATSRRPTPAPTSLSSGASIPTDVITLTWWTPEFISPQAQQPAGPLLAQQLAEFERINAERLRVSPLPKARYARGGLLDLLRTAQPVAPGILPDLVTLDVIELEQAVTTGLLHPLDSNLGETTLDALYPFARSAGEFGGQLLAVQYLADFEHVAYLTSALRTPPETWDELLRSKATPYLFALGAPQPSATTSRFTNLQDIVLSHYLSAGAKVDAANRQPALEETPLLRLLNFYQEATDGGLLPPNAIELRETDDIWDIFAQGRIPMAQVSARRYLSAGESLTGIGFAATPGWAGPAVPVASGWALAVVTTDPARQQAAADLIAWLLNPENAGPFAAAANWLPTSPAALDTWGRTPYHEFLDQQLAVAVNHPIGSGYSQVVARLQEALVAVLSQGASPQEAVTAALVQPR